MREAAAGFPIALHQLTFAEIYFLPATFACMIVFQSFGVATMSLFDSILSQVGGNLDVGSIAEKFGIDASTAEKAIQALGQSHAAPGDTVATAASSTGLDVGMLGQLASHLGGEGGLGQLSGLLQGNPALAQLAAGLDRDGDGNPLDDIAGMAKGLFGN